MPPGEPMRIHATNGTALAANTAGARRPVAGGFSLAAAESAPQTAGSAGLRSVSTMDALLALQGVEDLRERKKRAVARGRTVLDMLDSLKVGLLDGNLDPSILGRLKVAGEGLKDGSGDPGLDSVLAEIDLRVAVELAKAGVG